MMYYGGNERLRAFNSRNSIGSNPLDVMGGGHVGLRNPSRLQYRSEIEFSLLDGNYRLTPGQRKALGTAVGIVAILAGSAFATMVSETAQAEGNRIGVSASIDKRSNSQLIVTGLEQIPGYKAPVDGEEKGSFVMNFNPSALQVNGDHSQNDGGSQKRAGIVNNEPTIVDSKLGENYTDRTDGRDVSIPPDWIADTFLQKDCSTDGDSMTAFVANEVITGTNILQETGAIAVSPEAAKTVFMLNEGKPMTAQNFGIDCNGNRPESPMIWDKNISETARDVNGSHSNELDISLRDVPGRHGKVDLGMGTDATQGKTIGGIDVIDQRACIEDNDGDNRFDRAYLTRYVERGVMPVLEEDKFIEDGWVPGTDGDSNHSLGFPDFLSFTVQVDPDIACQIVEPTPEPTFTPTLEQPTPEETPTPLQTIEPTATITETETATSEIRLTVTPAQPTSTPEGSPSQVPTIEATATITETPDATPKPTEEATPTETPVSTIVVTPPSIPQGPESEPGFSYLPEISKNARSVAPAQEDRCLGVGVQTLVNGEKGVYVPAVDTNAGEPVKPADLGLLELNDVVVMQVKGGETETASVSQSGGDSPIGVIPTNYWYFNRENAPEVVVSRFSTGLEGNVPNVGATTSDGVAQVSVPPYAMEHFRFDINRIGVEGENCSVSIQANGDPEKLKALNK